MADKYFEDQLDDEEVLFVFRKHPIVMRWGLILAMIGILLGMVPALIKPELSYFYGGLAGGIILGCLLFFPSWIGWYYSVYIVTDQRLIQKTQKGLFNSSVVDLSLDQIQMINYKISGFQETILGFGTIVVQTYMGELIIHNVHHPARTQRKLLSILKEEGIVTSGLMNDKQTAKPEDEEKS